MYIKDNNVFCGMALSILVMHSCFAEWFTGLNPYVSPIKKEHAYLAGGILGGALIGAGLYAAYQAIKYRGMRMVCNSHADVANHINSMSTFNSFKLFDDNGNYDKKGTQAALKYFNEATEWHAIPQVEKNSLIGIYKSMKNNDLTCVDAQQILHDVSDCHKKVSQLALNQKCVDKFIFQLAKHMEEDLFIQNPDIQILSEPMYEQTIFHPFCIRQVLEDGTKKPIPLLSIAHVAVHRARIGLPILSKRYIDE